MSIEPLLSRAALEGHVQRLGAEVAADHPDGVVVVGVLKGALLFLADLVRAIDSVPVTVDFLAITRYRPDSGRVRLLQDLAVDVADRDVVLVEDIVDTGLTLSYLLAHLRERRPRRVDVCALLDRSVRRIVPLDVRYRGIEIGDVFVLGYGLHRADLYRNLSEVVVVDRDRVLREPDAYVESLYGAPGGSRDSQARW